MNILSFIRNLLPSFGKKDIREKLRIISRKITDVIQPSLEMFGEQLNEKTLKSAYGKGFMKDVMGMIPQRLRSVDHPYAMVLGVALTNGQRLVEQIEAYIGKNMGETIYVEGMSYQKASVIRLIELLDFFTDYAHRQLGYLVASETNIEAFDRPDGNPYTRAELMFLQSNQASFLRLMELFNGDPKKIMSVIENIPEVLMSDTEVGEVPALAGAAADPLQLGSIPGVSHIFHWVGLRMVDWDIERYEAALKTKRDIDLRLESLRQRRAGNLDAQTETIIDNYQRELTLARAKIARFEEKVR